MLSAEIFSFIDRARNPTQQYISNALIGDYSLNELTFQNPGFKNGFGFVRCVYII